MELLERNSMNDHAKICDFLAENGFVIWPNFITDADVAAARADILSLAKLNHLQKAGVGRGTQNKSIDTVRGDFTYWFQDEEKLQIRSRLLSQVGLLRETMNRELFLGADSFEGHYAHYPAGSFYKRHSDVFQNNDARVVSFVLYLNEPHWREEDGGQLRLFLDADSAKHDDATLDVRPEGGTLVCFMSQRFEHEVLKAHRDRFSFTGWFRRRN
jgi:SM-20-related protein